MLVCIWDGRVENISNLLSEGRRTTEKTIGHIVECDHHVIFKDKPGVLKTFHPT